MFALCYGLLIRLAPQTGSHRTFVQRFWATMSGRLQPPCCQDDRPSAYSAKRESAELDSFHSRRCKVSNLVHGRADRRRPYRSDQRRTTIRSTAPRSHAPHPRRARRASAGRWCWPDESHTCLTQLSNHFKYGSSDHTIPTIRHIQFIRPKMQVHQVLIKRRRTRQTTTPIQGMPAAIANGTATDERIIG